MLHLRSFTFDDAKPLFDADSYNDVHSEDIDTWVSKNMSEFSDARPAREADIKLLDRYKVKLGITLEVLDYHHVKLPKIELRNAQIWPKPNTVNCCYWNGEIRTNYHLEFFGDILIFSTYH